jgi:hypothetical protein
MLPASRITFGGLLRIFPQQAASGSGLHHGQSARDPRTDALFGCCGRNATRYIVLVVYYAPRS